jgi:hypothetical protein
MEILRERLESVRGQMPDMHAQIRRAEGTL